MTRREALDVFLGTRTTTDRGCLEVRVGQLSVRRSPMGACDRYRVFWRTRRLHEWRVWR